MVAVDEGGPASLIRDGETGLLRAADPDALATALLNLSGSASLRQRLSEAALREVRGRTWERAMAQLGRGYARAFEPATAERSGARPQRAA